MTTQPTVTSSQWQRHFVCSAVAIQAIIVNKQEQILLLASPHRFEEETWQVVSGALEAGETILEGALRETQEEAGAKIQVRPLGIVHAHTFHYDENVQYMIGIYYLLAYEGGQIQPGDDMYDSQYRWWSLDELEGGDVKLHASTHPWMLYRAIELYRLWQNQEVPLQLALRDVDHG